MRRTIFKKKVKLQEGPSIGLEGEWEFHADVQFEVQQLGDGYDSVITIDWKVEIVEIHGPDDGFITKGVIGDEILIASGLQPDAFREEIYEQALSEEAEEQASKFE